MFDEIDAFAVASTPEHPRDLVRVTADRFGVARQTAHKRIRRLVEVGVLAAEGKTKARRYSLAQKRWDFTRAVTPDLEENQVWLEWILPQLRLLGKNVVNACQYGFTEMVNNVIDHSESKTLLITLILDALDIEIVVRDQGIGIFRKIQTDLNLSDPRHALLELSKGKLTTDPARHSGEGIYYTSRMFDEYSIWSGELFFVKAWTDTQYLLETSDRSFETGTVVTMKTSIDSQRTIQAVFDESTTDMDLFPFSRTHVPIKLVKYPEEQLVSRSQAKRLLARFERFEEVMLDFEGVDQIGQAFADEIFRVFESNHPNIRIVVINQSKAVGQMISRVSASQTS